MVKYFCDVCGKEVDKESKDNFYKVFKDDVQDGKESKAFTISLYIKNELTIDEQALCEECFVKYVESTLKQVKKEKEN